MAFEPKPVRIVPKGLNLLAPGDQAAEGDCLKLDGFWPGSAGRLQQARGWARVNSASDAGIHLNALAESDGKLLFSDGSKLYEGDQDAAVVAAIDTGYDGYAPGMCAFQHVVWVMNRAKQRRVGTASGGAVPLSDWGSEASTPGAPSGSMAAGGGLADGRHTFYVTFVDQYGYETNPSPALVLDAPAFPLPGLSEGTVALTLGSATVTLSGATWGPEIDGQQFLVPDEYPSVTPPAEAPYTISYVDPTHGTLSANWAGVTNPAASYQLYSLAGRGKAKITRPSTVDATVTGWNVYRASPGLSGPYLCNLNGPLGYAAVGSDPNQTAADTYVDSGDVAHGQDDDALLAAGVLMEGDHDPPPAARVMASVPYNGRLVVANSTDHPNRIWYTNALEPNYFPGSGNPHAGNWVDIGDDTGDEILHMSVRPGMLIVYRARSIWRVLGDLGELNSKIDPLIPNMGIVGPQAVTRTSLGDMAVVKQGDAFGICRISDWEQKISQAIETLFTGVGSECYDPMNSAAASTCALGYQLGRLWFSYPSGVATTPDRTLVCDLEQGGRWFARAGGFGAYLHGSISFLGASGQSVHALESGNGDEDGSAVALAYQSRYEDAGNPDHEKTWADLVISHNTQGQDLTVNLKLNKGASTVGLGTINSVAATRQVITMPEGTDAFNAAVEITGDGYAGAAFTPVLIDGPIILHYFLKPRKAMTWDSGPTDHGVTGPKTVDAIEIDMEGGAAKLYVESDLMGSSMAERSPGGTGYALTATTGRAVRRVIVGPFTGRLYRYRLVASGATPLLVYRVRVRALPIGMLVDGAFGDTWYTEPMTIGSTA